MRAWTDQVSADVLVLTETHDAFSPGYAYRCASAPGRDGLHSLEHRWVTIWSKHEIEPLPASDRERTAAVRVFPVGEQPFVVCGVVLPWVGSAWRGHAPRGGVAFSEALRLQLSDWRNFRRMFPNDELFLLGDFNQDLVHPRYCGSQKTRAALTTALSEAGLVALTAGEHDPIRRDSPPFACIDHICALRDSLWELDASVRWPDLPRPDRRLSDHFGVCVSLTSDRPRFPIRCHTLQSA
jgi:hypothetical protein